MATQKGRRPRTGTRMVPADDLVEITAKVKRMTARYLTEHGSPPDYGIDRLVAFVMGEPQRIFERIDALHQEVLSLLRPLVAGTAPAETYHQVVILTDAQQAVLDAIAKLAEVESRGIRRFGHVEPREE